MQPKPVGRPRDTDADDAKPSPGHKAGYSRHSHHKHDSSSAKAQSDHKSAKKEDKKEVTKEDKKDIKKEEKKDDKKHVAARRR